MIFILSMFFMTISHKRFRWSSWVTYFTDCFYKWFMTRHKNITKTYYVPWLDNANLGGPAMPIRNMYLLSMVKRFFVLFDYLFGRGSLEGCSNCKNRALKMSNNSKQLNWNQCPHLHPFIFIVCFCIGISFAIPFHDYVRCMWI